MKESNKHNKKYLATTAIEDFWNVKMPILFLGEWCKNSNRKSFWEQLNYTDVKSSLDKKEQVDEARLYTQDLFNNAIKTLTEKFNCLHKENYSKRYWEIVLGPWLKWYINTVYTRYVNLKDVINNYEPFTTTLLSKEEHITPIDTRSFRNLSQTDTYNLQIYSRIFETLGMNYPTKSLENENINIYKENGHIRSGPFRFIKEAVRELVYKRQNNGSIFLVDSYFTNSDILKLFIITTGKVYPLFKIMPPISPVKLCQEKRVHLIAIEHEHSEFEMVFNRLLPFDVPICYIEGYKIIKQYIKSNNPRKPRVIFSSNSWYFRENIKIWAANSKESGTVLVGTQHGGNYGSVVYPHEANFETDITDRYYTWGWEKKNCNTHVIPFYSTKLSSRRKLGAHNSKQGVLFVTTKIFRYPLYIYRHSYSQKIYYSWQEIFMSKIALTIRPFFRIRLHKDDSLKEIRLRWASFAPEVQFVNRDNPFFSSLGKNRLFVSDHLSTTFVEALSANKPSILFWNPETSDLNEEAIPYYEMLENVGILHKTPEEAAEKVNAVYPDVEGWWNRPELQLAVNTFCNRYARTIPKVHKFWVKEFNNLLNESSNL
ncbi:MAG: hypothetical protein HQ541_11735 [Mariniphaga sp.]|nr:hypothetical protein [Mariniphaga sp.]